MVVCGVGMRWVGWVGGWGGGGPGRQLVKGMSWEACRGLASRGWRAGKGLWAARMAVHLMAGSRLHMELTSTAEVLVTWVLTMDACVRCLAKLQGGELVRQAGSLPQHRLDFGSPSLASEILKDVQKRGERQ